MDNHIQKLESMFKYYRESWKYFPNKQKDHETVLNTLKPLIKKEYTVLEIGPGGGLWTESISPLCNNIIGIDVNELPAPQLTRLPNFKYIKTDGYYCKDISDNSIDFVFSFGVFQHFPDINKREYLNDIKRVLKTKGIGLISFINYKRHYLLKKHKETQDLNKQYMLTHMFYDNLEISIKRLESCGFTNIVDTVPEFRDSLLLFSK